MKASLFNGPAVGLFAALLLGRPVLAANNTEDPDPPTLPLSTTPNFNFNFLVGLSNALSGGADIGPILGVAQKTEAAPGDFPFYTAVFHELALETKAQAEDPYNAFDPINVRDTWFSTAHYFRRADEVNHRNWSNPQINNFWEEQTAAFNKGLAALPIPGKRIQIPAPEGNFIVEAIWYAASGSNGDKLPTLIIGNGLDAAQEDSYHHFVAHALLRGWNCITYEGPGQPTVRRNQNLGFIPEWERVVTPVVDYVLSEKADVVDTDRLVLLGNSFGGYLGGRAAAFEPRLSAVILIGGPWDAYNGFSKQLPSELLPIYEAGNYTQFDHQVHSLREAGKLPPDAAWGLDYGLWAMNTHSPSEFFTQTKQYRLDDVVDQIEMPVLIADAELEFISIGQGQQVTDAIGPNAERHLFNGTAGYHCQTGAYQELTRTLHSWLHKTLGKGQGHLKNA
ncbi:hypothetical protein N8T08_002425 [Aspergillus melleus]|uniref:Uncharacterized protein n=1 Tax=Aspergillus melleus TaxID=138277 RepID=A0ACC3AM16_9EURO|nr:hypothetical protein N8T08_002425 [Aspergillus melleus]